MTYDHWKTTNPADAELGPQDCIYPDCLIPCWFGRACEHSCPYENVRVRGHGGPRTLCHQLNPTPERTREEPDDNATP